MGISDQENMSADKLDENAERAAMAECGHTDYDRRHNFLAMNSATRETRVKAIRAALAEAVAERDKEWGHALGMKDAASPAVIAGMRMYSGLALHVAVTEAVAEKNERIEELERRMRLTLSTLACGGCGGPHCFDTSVPSVVWNEVIRARGMSEYLCTSCIVKAFVQSGRSFTAQLWGDDMPSGIAIEVRVNEQPAIDAAKISEENTALRWKLSEAVAEERKALREWVQKRRTNDTASSSICADDLLAALAAREAKP